MITTHEATNEVAPPAGDLARVGAELAARTYARRGVSPSGETIRVALVDDHAILRAGLKALLHGVPDVVVVGEAGSGADAVALATRTAADVVVMDLDMPVMDGAAATRALAREVPSARVLILTMHSERERLLPLLDDGARGYLAKDAAERELVDAIRVVAGGDVYVRPTVSRVLARSVGAAPLPSSPPPSSPSVRSAAAHAAPGASTTRYEALSDRERTVLGLVAEGFNGPEIGERLGITAKTVDTYKQRIEDKLGLTHRSDYVRFALQTGLLPRAAGI